MSVLHNIDGPWLWAFILGFALVLQGSLAQMLPNFGSVATSRGGFSLLTIHT